MMASSNINVIVVVVVVVLSGCSIIWTHADGIVQICPPGYIFESEMNKCYMVSKDDRRSWKDARNQCLGGGGDLVVVRNEADNSFIRSLKDKYKIGRNIWLGLREVEIQNIQTFLWVSGEPLTYEKWQANEPTNNELPDPFYCVLYQISLNTWYDASCSNVLEYICEIARDINPTCGPGLVSNANNSECNWVVLTSNSFDGSRKECRMSGGDLVSVTDPATEELVIDIVNHLIPVASRYFIGLQSTSMVIETHLAVYKWLDGTLLDDSNPMTHFNHGSSDYCGTLHFYYGQYYFTDSRCDALRPLPAICEADMTNIYPTLECPHGFATHIEHGREVTCLKFVNDSPKPLSQASADCLSMGARLLTFDSYQLENVESYLVTSDKVYWGRLKSCDTYNITGKSFTQVICTDTYPYICQHWGKISMLVDHVELRSMEVASDVVPLVSGTTLDGSFLNYSCQFDRGSKVVGIDVHNWTMSMPFLQQSNSGDYSSTCLGLDKPDRCCVEVTLSSPQFSQRYVEIDMLNITVASWMCLCQPPTFSGQPNVMEQTTVASNTTYIPTTDVLTADELTTDIITTDGLTTDKITTDGLTTDNATTYGLTTDTITTDGLTTDKITTDGLTTDKITTDGLTTDNITTDGLTTDNATTYGLTTDKITTDGLTTDNITTNGLITDNTTTDGLTTDKIITDGLTTDKVTTDETTTVYLSTEKITTDAATSNTRSTYSSSTYWSVTINPTPDGLTTGKMTTDGLTSDKITTDGLTTDKITTGGLTTDNITTDGLTTNDTVAVATTTVDFTTNETTTTYVVPIQPTTPDRISKKTFDLLRNMTASKNESDPVPNKLYPCRCDSLKMNLNPTPEELSQMISVIQKELKVETQDLSAERIKKESAQDSRGESQALGYLAIVMCLVPLCLIVMLDATRLFQGKPKQHKCRTRSNRVRVAKN